MAFILIFLNELWNGNFIDQFNSLEKPNPFSASKLIEIRKCKKDF